MSKLFFPLPRNPDPLEALSNQGRSVMQFALIERESRDMSLPLTEPLDPVISAPGGLLDELILEPFFENPLPDTALAAAIKTPADPALSASVAEPTFSAKQQKAGEQCTSDTMPAKAGLQARSSHKPQEAKWRTSKEAEVENTMSAASKPQKAKPKASAVNQAIEQKVTFLEESQKPAETKTVQRQAGAVAEFVGNERKADVKSSMSKTSATSPARRARPMAVGEISGGGKKRPTISSDQAAKLLEKRWQRPAWKSPIQLEDRPGKKDLLRHGEEQALSPQSGQSPQITEERLEQKVAQLLDREIAATERAELPASMVAAEQRQGGSEATDSSRIRAQQSLNGPDSEHLDSKAFTPAPSTPANPQALVGLRGLAARAAANEFATGSDGREQSATQVDQAPGRPVAQPGAHGPSVATDRPLSVSELAEVIAQEAKRAGINLEQFQP